MPVREKETEEKKVKIGAEVPVSVHKMLGEVCKWYRTDNISHCLRMMIEDVWKGIQQDTPALRMGGTENRFVEKKKEEVMEEGG